MPLQGVNLAASKVRGLGQRPKPGDCFLCGKEGPFKWECPKAQTPAPRPCPICQEDHWKMKVLGVNLSSPGSRLMEAGPVHIGSCPHTTQEPQVSLNVGGQPIHFLLDMGATFSVLLSNPGPPSNKSATIRGISGKPVTKFSTQPFVVTGGPFSSLRLF